MVRAILFEKFWKIWPVIEGDNLVPKCHSVLPLAVGDLGTRLNRPVKGMKHEDDVNCENTNLK